VQPGYLFRYDEEGRPQGLVKGKRMVCVSSRGGDYSGGPLQAFDFVENYLRTIFGFVGITDITFFNVQPMDVSIEARKAAIKNAIREVRQFVHDSHWEFEVLAPRIEMPKELKPAAIVE
jgi:FMN-dependent NADH-azoreductase